MIRSVEKERKKKLHSVRNATCKGNVSGLASGVYLVKLTTDKGNVLRKVVKE